MLDHAGGVGFRERVGADFLRPGGEDLGLTLLGGADNFLVVLGHFDGRVEILQSHRNNQGAQLPLVGRGLDVAHQFLRSLQLRIVLRDGQKAREGRAHCRLRVIEALERLRRYGPNILARTCRLTVFDRFLSKLANPLIILLLIAGGLSASLGQLSDFVIIIINYDNWFVFHELLFFRYSYYNIYIRFYRNNFVRH